MRPLSIPCMKDRAMQTLYKFALEPIAEITADPNSYGFRAKRCVQDAIEQCFTCLNKAKSPKWVLEGDIKGCFDNISHEWILNHIPMDRDILRKWLKSGYVETGRLFPTDLGSPQGSAISPTICNMVLDGLEIQIRKKYHKTKRDGKAYFPKVNFIRYADAVSYTHLAITGKAGDIGFIQRNGWFGRGYRQTVKLSDFVSHPHITVECGFCYIPEDMNLFIMVSLSDNTSFPLLQI